MVDQIKSKGELVDYLNQRISNKHNPNQKELAQQMNFNRLNSLMGVTCAKVCISDFNTQILSANDNLCLTECARRFYDSVQIGNEVFKDL